MGPEPESIWEVLHRHKDIQYSSRVASHIARQRQVHKLRHVVSELVKLMPEDVRNRPVVKDLAEYGCLTRMHVVQLLAPRLDNRESHQGHRFQPGGDSPALGGGLCRHQACAAAHAVERPMRSARRRHPARAGDRRGARGAMMACGLSRLIAHAWSDASIAENGSRRVSWRKPCTCNPWP